ncbi:MAG: TolC family protein [Kofleriaceae bacterium]
MRLLRSALAALLILPGVARADVIARIAQAGDDAGGGSSTAQAQPGDLDAWAGPARATTLPELLSLTVRQAPALAAAKIDIAIAEAQIQQTHARHDWTIGAQLTGELAFATRDPDLDPVSGAGSVDIGRALPTGGTIGLHADSTYTTFADGGGGTASQWFDRVGVAMTQPLMRGAGRAIFDAAERQAVLSRDAAVLARRLAAIQTVQTVISAYWDLVLAQRQVEITRASLELANERLRITMLGSQGGKIPRAEIPAVQQIIATREEDVLDGELAVLDRSINVRRAAGMAIGAGELGLRVQTELGAQDKTWELGQLVERSYTASPELAQLAKQTASTTIAIEVTEDGLLPQLDAALQLGPIGIDSTFGGAWKNLGRAETIGISGTLTFRQSISRDDVRGRSRELRETRRKIEVTAADVKMQLAQTMSRAVAQLELARRRVTLSQRAIELAKENIKIETDRFNLGKSTNFDVLNRQEELRQAELRKAQAMIDGHKAETVVQALTGDLLPAYGISLE